MMSKINQISNGVEQLPLKVIKIYQSFVSPLLGRHCRFYPSCSEYTLLSIKKYGAVLGCWQGLKRILKCHPCHPGGVDLP